MFYKQTLTEFIPQQSFLPMLPPDRVVVCKIAPKNVKAPPYHQVYAASSELAYLSHQAKGLHGSSKDR